MSRPNLGRRAWACTAAIVLGLTGCTENSTVEGSTSGSVAGAESANVTPTPSVVPVPSPTPSVIDIPTPPPSTPPSLDPAAQEAAERAAVEAQWVKFWQVYENIVRTPQEERTRALETVSVDPLKTRVLDAASTFESQGLDYYGTVVQHPYWLDPINGQDFAVMRDCQDQSQYGSVFVDSGEKRTVGIERNSLQAGFIRGQDGIWRVQNLQYLENVPC